MTALRLEEKKHKRLERTIVLKMILGKKLGNKKLKRMMLMMEQRTMEDIEMEIGEEYSDPRDEDENNKSELSNHEENLKVLASCIDEDNQYSEDLVRGQRRVHC